MKYEAFVFDFDGTIADTGRGITNCVRHALQRMGRPDPGVEELRRFIGPPLVYSFQEFSGMTQEEAVEATAIYRERYAPVGLFEAEPYPGMVELLMQLKARGARVVIASGKPEQYLRRLLEHFDLMKYFDAVAGPDPAHCSADKSDLVRLVLNGVDPARACMIGDRMFDMDAGLKVGMHNVGVAYGYGSRQELVESGAHDVAESVAELAEYLLAD